MNSTWTDEDAAKLTELWNVKGLSASQISAEFNGRFSRNSIIGKSKRLKLDARKLSMDEAARTERTQLARQRRNAKRRDETKTAPNKNHLTHVFGNHYGPAIPKDIRPPRERAFDALPGALFLSLLDLTPHTCKWSCGFEHTQGFCGLPTVKNSKGSSTSWCEVHLGMSLGRSAA